ncbi:MAG: hypothetical protein J0L86_08120 [Flavobacteriales bacterium]|nr:hypothetical protein [Flavobacteriales bacterium]
MKNLQLIVLFISCLFVFTGINAQEVNQKPDSTVTTQNATSKKNDVQAKNKLEKKCDECNMSFKCDLAVLKLIIVIFFFIIMAYLIYKFFNHIELDGIKQRIGFQSIKLIGLILMFPGICMLALVGGESVLSGQTLAVLLGTIAGYILSRDDDKNENVNQNSGKKDPPKPNPDEPNPKPKTPKTNTTDTETKPGTETGTETEN